MRRLPFLVAGVLALLVVLAPPLHRAAETSLTAHMAQHLLLTLVAAPLLLLGGPVAGMLRALPPRPRHRLARAGRSRLVRAITRPPVAWTAFVSVICLSHLPAVYDAALRSPWLHAAEHWLYLATALLFWLPLVGREPLPHRPLPLARLAMLLLAMPPMALIGVALSSSGHAWYAEHSLSDQRTAGVMLWFGGTILMVAATLAVGWTALAREERRARTREAYGR